MSSIALRYAPERDEALLYVNGGYYKVLKSLNSMITSYEQKPTSRQVRLGVEFKLR